MKNKNLPSRIKGQSMVEFAIALPVLLLIVFGLLEAGRLIFAYGSVTTASRQAVRYGSATGDNGAGTRKYLDCDGIQAAAQDMGFILPIATVDIVYTRDGQTFADCDETNSDYDLPVADEFRNGDRIEVTTTSPYAPIIPIAGFANFDLVANSKRTIFIGIAISEEPAPWVAAASVQLEGFARSISPTTTSFANPNSYTTEGEEIEFKFILTNTGDTDLTSYSIATDIDTCSDSGVTISPNQPVECIFNYTITSDNYINRETITINANADASDGITTTTASASSILTFAPSVILTLDDITSTIDDNNIVTFTYTLSSQSNVPLSGINLSDTEGLVIYNAQCNISPAGLSIICTSNYAITDADIAAGTITHAAQIQAIYEGAPLGNPATGNEIVYTQPFGITFDKAFPNPYIETTAKSGISLTLNFKLHNYALTEFSNPTITFDLKRLDGTLPYPSTITLDCGTTLTGTSSISCNSTYTLTQADLNAGGIRLLNVTATAIEGSKTHTAETTVSPILVDPETHLDISIHAFEADGVSLTDEDALDPNYYLYTADNANSLTYTYRITNVGNIDIPAGTTITIAGGPSECSITLQSALLRYAPIDCQTTYSVADADRYAGSILSPTITAASSTFSWGGSSFQATTSTAISNTVYTHAGERISLEIIPSTGNDIVSIGDPITFTYILKNTGSTVINDTFTFTDATLPEPEGLENHTISCPSIAGDFYPQDIIVTCYSALPYTVDLSDVINNDSIIHTVKVLSAGGFSIKEAVVIPVDVPTQCFTHDGPLSSAKKIKWTITNETSEDIEVTEIGIYFENKNLTSIFLGSSAIWTITKSPPGFSFNPTAGSIILTPGQNDITFVFQNNQVRNVSSVLSFGSSDCVDLNSDIQP